MNWDYIAGFIDGEGSIIVVPPRVRIYISNTNKKVLERICKFIGAGKVSVVKRQMKENWKEQYAWTLCEHSKCLEILKKLENKLIIKREKCQEAIKYIESKRWIGNYLTKEELEKFGKTPYRKIALELKVSPYCVFRYQKKYGLR